ncbi:MAG TPA: PilN domain-containing protein [Phycisphaerae bacterium]|nr:PilN domain-containing protein [Phycisphaerae bacterium]
MIGVNVLPQSYIRAKKRASRLRGWLIAVTVVTFASAFPVGFDVFKAAKASTVENELKPLRSQLTGTKNKLSESLSMVTDLRQRLSRADAIRSKRPWKNLMATLTAKMPQEVWLTSLESYDHAPKATVRRAATKEEEKSDTIELEGPAGLRLTGFALEHEQLLAFMAALNDGVLFNRVDMVKSGQVPLADGVAVRFVLECTW